MIPGAAIAAGAAALMTSLLISAVMTPLVRRWSIRRGFVDQPLAAGEHKAHKQSTSLGGGIAIILAVVLPMAGGLLAARYLGSMSADQLGALSTRVPHWRDWAGGVVSKTPEALAIIAGALIMHLLGIIDDHRPLSAGPKLAVQLAVAVALTGWFGVRSVEALGPAVSVIFTTLWIVILTNAFNFMDNMDGLSAGVAGLTAIILAISSFLAGQVFVPCLLLMLAGAVGGFLIYNFPPASIFMGDAGSLVVGYLLAVCTVLTTFYNPEAHRTPFGVLVPLVVFAIPLYDFSSVILYRLRRGVSIFRGDRRHFSHRLVRRGLTPTMAVLTIYLATLATALPAILLPLHGWSVAILILGQCVCVVAIIAILEVNDGS